MWWIAQSVKSTGVGGEERGYDGGKKVKGGSDIYWWTRGLRAQSQGPQRKVMDYEGIKSSSKEPTEHSPAFRTCGWTPATAWRGQRGGLGGEDPGMERGCGGRPKKPAPEEVLMRWAREWAREGVSVDWRKLMPPKGFIVLPRRWVIEIV